MKKKNKEDLEMKKGIKKDNRGTCKQRNECLEKKEERNE
jgi:hypothetical protein